MRTILAEITQNISSNTDPVTIIWVLGGVMVAALASVVIYQEGQKKKKDELIKEKDKVIMETALLLRDFIHAGEKSNIDIKSVEAGVNKVLEYTSEFAKPKLSNIEKNVEKIIDK